jgi:Flp pilus assembly protein TadD
MAGDQPEQQIDKLNRQVVQLDRQGKYQEALELAREVCELAGRVLGKHPYTAMSLNNLGVLLDAKGDLAAARRYYEQALEIHCSRVGNDHLNTAEPLNNLACVLRAMGDLAGARSYFQQALGIFRRVLGNDHPRTAVTLSNLGALLRAMGDLVGARKCHEEALEIRSRVLGEEHPDTANSLNNLCALLNDNGGPGGRTALLRASPGDPPPRAGQRPSRHRHKP